MSLHRTFLCIALHAASLGTPIAHAQEARSVEEERATFTLADGFVAELVADERVMRKAVAFNFDNAGRMWVTTASDYPLDANEQPEKAAALYRDGGNDNVLIFDTPWAEGLQRPRIWAGREGEGNVGISGVRDSGNLREGAGNSARSKNPEIPKSRNPGIPLAMPMGVLPYKDGAIVQHGADLLFLRDTNADGKADTKEVLLTGFGIEDSHLMPHGFTRGPGDWIYFAQGAFNTSRVKTKEGAEVLVKFCKMMRMKPDGAQFEICSWGPNNIWGFAIDPRGEMWIQEANDMGYPVAPFQAGMTYPGIGDDKPKPYAPVMPPPKKMNDCTMGGTGLSGLALNEDPATWPAPWTGAFMIANPITNKIQAIRVHRDAPGYDGVKLEKLPDFLVSEDKNFRPVAIQFGPDGALYIIDWYNKIISHNEVPRAHPDRDKERTRIWRIRATNAPRREAVNLEKADVRGLVARLGSANQWEANAARFELNDRGLVEEIGDDSPESLRDENNLHRIARDTKKPVAERLRAITALSVYGYLNFDTPVKVAKENNAIITREVLRAVRTLDWSVYEIADYFQKLVDDSDPGVRLALLTQLAANYAEEGPEEWLAIRTLLRFAKPPESDSLGISGNLDRRIERYVIRSALERERAFLAKFLDGHRENDLSPEALALIALTIEPQEGARKLLATLPRLRRPLIADEIALLSSQIDALPSARAALETLLLSANEQYSTLSALARIDSRLLTAQGAEAASWQRLIVRAARDLFRREPTNTNGLLIVRLAKNLRLRQLEPDIVAYIREPARKSAEQIEGVKVLRELGSNAVDLFRVLAAATDEQLRRESLLSLASATSERVVPLFVELWLQLSPPLRRIAMERLASSKTQASALVRAAKEGAIPADDLDGATLDKLAAVLGENHPDLTVVLRELKGALRPVLRLSGKPGGIAETKIDLPGPFTIETWVRLDAGVDNSDNLLGRKGGADINFHDAKLRFFANQTAGDLVIARTAIKPERWTHIAVTRDGAGKFRIYLDGELDAESESTFTEPLTGLDIGETNAGRGCAAAYTEFRVWDVARSTEEIRDNYLLSFVSMDAPPENQHRTSNIEHRTSKEALPRHLVRYMSGAQGWGALKGQARIEQTRDFPELLTPADAAVLATKFARYRALASNGGTAENGRGLFAAVCMVCHEVKGEGGKIGPTLSGAGAMGTESLLRNILAPNAQLESGYYRHDIELKSGDVLSGFLVSQHEGHIVLRQLGADDRTIARVDIKKLSVAKKSLMPEGLLDGLNPEQVRDLFAYLRTLR